MKAFLILTVSTALLQAGEPLAILGEKIFTMAGPPVTNGVVLVADGKIQKVGQRDQVRIPSGYRRLEGKIITPGLIDARSCIGLSGILNQSHDQEQVDKSTAIQPELRALDSYNARDPLVEWVRRFGVTTIHTGHAPAALVSGQTIIVKTFPENPDQALLMSPGMITASLGRGATETSDKAPGTGAKAIAMLRSDLIKALEYSEKQQKEDVEKRPARNLKSEALKLVLEHKIPLLITAHRYHEILAALRLAEEFNFKLILDGASEVHLVLDEVKKSGFPVLLHPTMFRASEERENLSMETASKLHQAGIPFALQSGFESYVPKARVVLFEAAIAAANGLGQEAALQSITINPARILGIAERVGSLEIGKDADLVLYDGDPFEYTTHCTAVVISGEIVSNEPH